VQGQSDDWISAARTPDGGFVMHQNGTTPRFWLHNAAGTLTAQVPLGGTVPQYSSDIGVFPDGVVAISTRGEGLRLYDLAGNQLGTVAAPGLDRPFGLQVLPDETVWVVDQGGFPVTQDGRVFHLTRQGQVLDAFDVAFSPSDVAEAPDGTVWVSDYQAGMLHHFQANGTPLGSFPAQISSTSQTLWSVAVTSDGVVWATGHYEDRVHGFDAQGNVLFQYDLLVPGNSVALFAEAGVSWATPTCLGDGTGGLCTCGNTSTEPEGCLNSTGRGARLDVAGSNRVTDDDLRLVASNLPPGRTAMAVAGTQTLSGAIFGDGLRCAGGTLTFLGARFPDSAGNVSWGPNLGALGGGWSGGDTRVFQVWYRDPLGGACGLGSNSSNGQEVVFLP
jgi:sugar lactone lactonase YvrE